MFTRTLNITSWYRAQQWPDVTNSRWWNLSSGIRSLIVANCCYDASHAQVDSTLRRLSARQTGGAAKRLNRSRRRLVWATRVGPRYRALDGSAHCGDAALCLITLNTSLTLSRLSAQMFNHRVLAGKRVHEAVKTTIDHLPSSLIEPWSPLHSSLRIHLCIWCAPLRAQPVIYTFLLLLTNTPTTIVAVDVLLSCFVCEI